MSMSEVECRYKLYLKTEAVSDLLSSCLSSDFLEKSAIFLPHLFASLLPIVCFVVFSLSLIYSQIRDSDDRPFHLC